MVVVSAIWFLGHCASVVAALVLTERATHGLNVLRRTDLSAFNGSLINSDLHYYLQRKKTRDFRWF